MKKLNFSQIFKSKVDFFKSIANSKQIEFILDIKENVFIVCDIKTIKTNR